MDNLFKEVERMAPMLAETVDKDEQNGRLSESVVNAFRQLGLYRLFLPASLGGLEADPLTVAKLMEQIARHNAAAAWSVMVANTSHWFCKFLPAEEAAEIGHIDKNLFSAGSFAAPIFATAADGGYSIKGQVPLCSNVHLAEWVTLLSIVMQDGRPVMNNGMPEMRVVTFKKEECRVLDTWHALGMKSTDSNDVVVENVFVPRNRSFLLSPYSETNKYYQGPLYRFPLTGITSCCLIVPVALAIASNAIEELKLLTGKVPTGSATTLKEKSGYQQKLARAEALAGSARVYLHHALSDCWNKVQSGEQVAEKERAALLLAAAHVNHSCTMATDLVYSAAGTTGIYKRNKISRYFTDMQVVRQHGFSNENRFETAAQLMLGLQPDFPAALF